MSFPVAQKSTCLRASSRTGCSAPSWPAPSSSRSVRGRAKSRGQWLRALPSHFRHIPPPDFGTRHARKETVFDPGSAAGYAPLSMLEQSTRGEWVATSCPLLWSTRRPHVAHTPLGSPFEARCHDNGTFDLSISLRNRLPPQHARIPHSNAAHWFNWNRAGGVLGTM